jgi:hypothetical protein
MKSIILLLIACILYGETIIAQSSRDSLQNATDRAYYLRLRKTQKTQATVLVATGGIAIALGSCIWYLAPIAGLSETGNVEGAESLGKKLIVVGSGLAALSIPLFHSSKENRKKAELYIGSSHSQFPLKGSREMLCIGTRIMLP